MICAHDDRNVKMSLMNKLHEELCVLEAGDGSEHQHNDLEIAPERGLSKEQKRITLECYARDCGDPSDCPSRP